MNSIKSVSKKNLFVDIIKGALISLSATLIMILLFAVLIRFFNIPDGWIFPINQVIKVASIVLGLIAMLKANREQGFLKGVFLGAFYFVLSFFIFSILQGNFSISIKNLYDFLLTTLMGGLVGIILVNILK